VVTYLQPEHAQASRYISQKPYKFEHARNNIAEHEHHMPKVAVRAGISLQ
jgi:hypothetical protein